MKETEERIKKLDTILKNNNAPILNYFNPGLAKQYIIEYFNQRDIVLRPELIPLY